MSLHDELQTTIAAMVQKGKGILALDESSPAIAKRFKAIDVESTEENRRAYRSLILSTPDMFTHLEQLFSNKNSSQLSGGRGISVNLQLL